MLEIAFWRWLENLYTTDSQRLLRVGDYMVVFKVVEQEVRVLGIINRKDVYDRIQKRISRGQRYFLSWTKH